MLEIRILGPLEVGHTGRPIDMPRGKVRLLLAALVVHADRVVSTGRLFEYLWGDRPPLSADNTLQTYVSQLRRSLEPDRMPRQQGSIVITQEPGYRLAVDPDWVDAGRFERLVGEARLVRTDAPDEAAPLLRTALSLWRGEPLADFTFEPFAQSEITRLTELRLTALEDWVDAELALGGHTALCGELAQLVREHPLRERLSGQQMVALYRSGRQADALRAYTDLRERLVEELGIDRSPTLVHLQHAILRQVPELDWPPVKSVSPSSPPVPAGQVENVADRPSTRLHESHGPRQTIDQEIRYCLSPDGTCIAYAVAGDGPPLVKAANWLTHLRAEWKARSGPAVCATF